jgi:hypothetical protein
MTVLDRVYRSDLTEDTMKNRRTPNWREIKVACLAAAVVVVISRAAFQTLFSERQALAR